MSENVGKKVVHIFNQSQIGTVIEEPSPNFYRVQGPGFSPAVLLMRDELMSPEAARRGQNRRQQRKEKKLLAEKRKEMRAAAENNDD